MQLGRHRRGDAHLYALAVAEYQRRVGSRSIKEQNRAIVKYTAHATIGVSDEFALHTDRLALDYIHRHRCKRVGNVVRTLRYRVSTCDARTLESSQTLDDGKQFDELVVFSDVL